MQFGAATNQLLNSTSPATQTTGSLNTGVYTLWVNAPNTSTSINSATMSAGTATGCGTGVATQNAPVTFTITVAGTCTVTVAGTLAAFQLEGGAFGTPLIVTAGATAGRLADNNSLVITVPLAFTLFGVYVPQSAAAVQNTIIVLDDNSLSNWVAVNRSTTGAGKADSNGGTGWTMFPNQTMTVGAQSGIAVSVVAGSQKASDKNSTVTTATAAVLPSGLSRMRFGSLSNASGQANGIITLGALYPAALDTAVSTLTTPY